MHLRVMLALTACGLAARSLPLRAQNAAPAAAACTYADCALRFEPGNWSSRLVRGSSGRLVGRIGPFNSSAVDSLLAGPDSAVAYARHFQAEDRKAGTYGLLSLASVGFAVIHAANESDVGRVDVAAWAFSLATTLLGNTHRRRADSNLSRSVWWYNAALPR